MKTIILKKRAIKGYIWILEQAQVIQMKLKNWEKNYSKINLSILFKAATTKKLRLRIWAYSVGKYLYIHTRSALTLRNRTYSTNQNDKDFLE